MTPKQLKQAKRYDNSTEVRGQKPTGGCKMRKIRLLKKRNKAIDNWVECLLGGYPS